MGSDCPWHHICVTMPEPRRPDQRAPLEVWSCKFLEQAEAVEHSCPWTEEEPHWIITVWRDSSTVQAKLSVAMIWHHKLQASALTALLQQRVRWLNNVAQSEKNNIPFGCLLNAVWTVNSDLNQIYLQCEHSLSILLAMSLSLQFERPGIKWVSEKRHSDLWWVFFWRRNKDQREEFQCHWRLVVLLSSERSFGNDN